MCHLLSTSLLSYSVEAGHEYKLKNAAEHKDHGGQHPDVEEGDVGDAGDALPDGGEHGGEGEQGRHPHPHLIIINSLILLLLLLLLLSPPGPAQTRRG